MEVELIGRVVQEMRVKKKRKKNAIPETRSRRLLRE